MVFFEKTGLNWSVLGRISGSKIAYFSIVVSGLGYLVILDDRFSELTCSLSFQELCDSSFLSWRIVSTYLGFVLLAVSSIIFTVFCPSKISRYRTREEYIEYYIKNASGTDLKHLYFDTGSQLGSEFTNRAASTLKKFSKDKISVIDLNTKEELFSQAKVSFLGLAYDIVDVSRFRVRSIASCAALLGIVLTAAPALWTTCLAVWALFS